MIGDLLAQCAQHLDADAEPRLPALIESVASRGQSPIPLYDLASVCRRQGHMDLWRAALDSAFARPHESYEQIYHRGRARLLLDDWSGWQDLEVRIYDPRAGYLSSRAVRVLRYNIRAWDGRENIKDKSLYVVADGGFGDCLQFSRYIPILAERAARLVLCVRPEVASLVRQAYGDRVTLTLQGVEDTKTYDRYAWMMSLPALIGDLPPFAPLPVAGRRQKIASPESRIAVGVCWAGDPEWSGDVDRSLSVNLLSSLIDREDIRWVNLQTGSAREAISTDARVIAPAKPLYSFAQSASILWSLDAVVTVDTATAHLAGALGVPTWVLLSADADPRWGTGATTRWYPSVRLVRQRVAGDWADVLAAVEAELETCAQHAATV
jgi:hypothetical protein